jgi:hypothetical protein
MREQGRLNKAVQHELPPTERFHEGRQVHPHPCGEPAPDTMQPSHEGEAEDLDARVLLLHAPPLAVNPLTATDGGLGSGSNGPDPSLRRPSSTIHS